MKEHPEQQESTVCRYYQISNSNILWLNVYVTVKAELTSSDLGSVTGTHL